MASLPVLRVVGQVMSRYIVAEGPDGLYLIDQHAAHERIRYDKVKRQREQRQPEVQGLLEPATLEVTPRQDAMMRSCLEELRGFRLCRGVVRRADIPGAGGAGAGGRGRLGRDA